MQEKAKALKEISTFARRLLAIYFLTYYICRDFTYIFLFVQADVFIADSTQPSLRKSNRNRRSWQWRTLSYRQIHGCYLQRNGIAKGYIVNKAIVKEENSKLKTIYLGGGTPSQLSFRNLQQIFHQITTVYSEILDDYNSMEVTLECNPDDVTDDFALEISRLPINRISMGVQTFTNDRLRFIKRRHNAEEIGVAVRRLRNIGIQNISIDLMFGFPQENLDDWKKTLTKLLLSTSNISPPTA